MSMTYVDKMVARVRCRLFMLTRRLLACVECYIDVGGRGV